REHGVSLISATLNDAVFSGASFNNNGFGGPAGNGGDGVHIETSMVDGLAIVNNGVATSLSSNQGSGVEITDSTVSDLAIGGAEVIGNLADGILAQGMTTLNNLQVTNSRIDNNLGSGANLMDVVLNGALFADSSFDFNEGHGFAVIGGTFNDATFINGSLFFNGMPMGGDGFHGEDAAISNLTFDSIGDAFPSVNQNNGTGISIVGGGLDGLIIRNADVLGNQGAGLLADTDLQGDIRIGSETTFDRFIGNLGGAGVDLTDRDTMTAVGTLSIEATVSTFNAGEGVVLRGLAVDTLMLTDVGFNDNMGDGLSIINGAFTTAAITGATIFSNAGNGIAADGAMFGNGGPAAMGFALHASQIVGNAGNGVAFENVNASGVTIMDTDVAVNGVNGVYVDGGTLAGFAIRNSHLGEILDTMGMVEFIGNFGNGLLISNAAIDDLVIDGGTMVVRNGVNGIAISASGLGMTDGSILFGITTITDNMTGILVNNANAQAPLLITFGPTTINGGVDGLFLSGAGIGLTGGGSIPGGSPVGGGVMPGDNLFGGSLGNLAFNGQTGTFVTLMNGALFDPGMPTVIDASNVTFDGTPADMLDDMERQDVMDRIIDFNDDMTVGLIFLPPPPVMMVPSPAENPGLIDELPGKENTPGDTLFRLTDGIEFNPDPGQPNAFCFGYSLADGQAPGGVEGEDEAVVCADLPSTPAPVNPNQGLGNFWQGWQAARR
ncbi:MAG TPA: right-handed parallel beta-helix repeat-containing protein, partial [Sinorhizobium sp.]|nr:right-handed parallel beta-helix repeat-containing protein [Sinorhizobium sp.]